MGFYLFRWRFVYYKFDLFEGFIILLLEGLMDFFQVFCRVGASLKLYDFIIAVLKYESDIWVDYFIFIDFQ